MQLAEQQAAQQADYNRAKSESTADYTRQKNAYQQAQAQAIADWEAESLARMQNYQQNYYNSLSQLSRQQSSRSSGGSKKTTQKSAADKKTTSDQDLALRWAALRATINDRKLAALDKRDSG